MRYSFLVMIVLAGAATLACAQIPGGAGGSGDYGLTPDEMAESLAGQPTLTEGIPIEELIRSAIDIDETRGEGLLRTPDGALVVTTTPSKMKVIEQLVAAMDEVPPQVSIEARFVDINTSHMRQIAVEFPAIDNLLDANRHWDVETTTDFGVGPQDIGLQSGTAEYSEGGIDSAYTQATITRLEHLHIEALLTAIEKDTTANTLSAPRVTTTSGSAAFMTLRYVTYLPEAESSERITFLTDPDNPNRRWSGVGPYGQRIATVPTELEPVETGISLTVTPTVSADRRTITLDLQPQVTSLQDGQAFGEDEDTILLFPRVTENLETIAIVGDGDTLVVGGSVREREEHVVRAVPLLGRIPGLRWLFRREHDSVESRSLLIFVTAEILTPAGEPWRAVAQ